MGNPTLYLSLNGDYGRAVGDTTGYCQMPEVTVAGYQSKFRVFIPPGTNYIYLAIYEYGGQTAIARQRILPTTFSIPQDYFAPQSRTLDQLLASDQLISENNEGKLTIINQVLQGGTYVSVYQAGWLYVYVTGGKYSSVYYNKLQIGMDAATYNKWYDTINWDIDVESVLEYRDGPPSLSVTPTSRTIPKEGGIVTFDVSNTGAGVMPWTARAVCVSWFSITSGTSGSNTGTITCRATKTPITSLSPTVNKIFVTAIGAAGSPVELLVEQESQTPTQPELIIEPHDTSVTKGAGTATIKVSNIGAGTMPWEARVLVTLGSPDWLSIISGANGTDAGDIVCSFTANDGGIRRAMVQVTASVPTTWNGDWVDVVQADGSLPKLDVTPTILAVSKIAGTTTFDITNTGTGNMAWTVAVTPASSWLSINSRDSGTDAATVTCSFTSNTGAERTAQVKVDAGGDIKTVSVIQASASSPLPPKLSVSPSSISVSGDGGTAQFNISKIGDGDMPWTATIVLPCTWLSFIFEEEASGTNDGCTRVYATANTGAERTAQVKVEAGSDIKTVSVIQAKPVSKAEGMVNDIASKLSSISQAKRNVDQMKSQLEAIASTLSSAGCALISGNKYAKTIEYFLKNKVAGSFGSYGIQSQIDKLTAMSATMVQEMSFCKTAISMYNQVDKGVSSLTGMAFPPGFDSSTYSSGFSDDTDIKDYYPDNDHLISKFMLKKAADFRMVNRPGESPYKAIKPDNPEIGDMICVYGIVYVYTYDPEDPYDIEKYYWYPVGLQEPKCNQNQYREAVYDRSHVLTTPDEDDLNIPVEVDPNDTKKLVYRPFCRDDPALSNE